MPRDVIANEETTLPAARAEATLSRRAPADPSLSGLAYMLRHKETWPPGHRWDFRYALHHHETGCTSGCALGIAALTWFEESGRALVDQCGDGPMRDEVGAAFGAAFTAPDPYNVPRAMVTPGMVADELDRIVGEYGDRSVNAAEAMQMRTARRKAVEAIRAASGLPRTRVTSFGFRTFVRDECVF